MPNSIVEIGSDAPDTLSEQKQRRRMLGALALLLVALILVLAKDWDFWFPPESADIDSSEQAPHHHTLPRMVPQTSPAKPPVAAHKNTKPAAPPGPTETATTAPVVTTNRAVLPPLEIEVVAGNQHQPVQARNNSVKVDLQDPAEVKASNNVENAAARVTLSPATAGMVSRSVDPNYPLLAKEMKVQGSVVLQAIIGTSGNIEDLRVVSGPSILSDAARQAVKQWRFKPYLQAGQPVETEARITVNFTISTY